MYETARTERALSRTAAEIADTCYMSRVVLTSSVGYIPIDLDTAAALNAAAALLQHATRITIRAVAGA